MPATTREKLADAALRRFYRDGFRNVGIDQVLADVGISKTAFYKHFECKEDLVLLGLERHDIEAQEMFDRVTREVGGPTALGRLYALFDVVEQIIGDEEFHGCVFVNVAIEFPLPHDPAHVAAANSKRAVEKMVGDLATEAGADDPAALAHELCLIMEGAYVTRSVGCEGDTISAARRLARLAIKSRCGACPQ
ncbi:TetR/AcrR family transcriptional regulator [Botrimarina mediterranea]|uniref:HTH-type transcriptional regulator YjdC n=1 Tax=Botrimarina mediterranea TaxID=2528022 RepID=A0A518K3B6_9BACT|nr:TetR family transcriptional regulator [Botrimarina mediterranea]QDV72293.1 HTH-type transcriptional regulator YjdC [Botrimarina mediterranea]QDV76837.1 HTH-type transcriptional regulator YjdC [Planctomycetes bacterium K2D]